MDAASELLKLAEEKFGKLTPAEKKLFRKTAEGEIADYSPKSKKPIDPANAAKWGPSRVLLADRIAWLCTDGQAAQFVTHRGIHVGGSRIDEELDLLFANIPFPLHFQLCKFTADINLRCAQIAALNMDGTHTGPLAADSFKVNGPVYLRDGFNAEGEVRLLGATVGGNLDCRNAQFVNQGGDALSADGLNVSGHVYLCDGFEAQGTVRLLGATISGDLTCTNARFINKGGVALGADGLKVEGAIFLRNGFRAEGEVRLLRAAIGRVLDCDGGQFINKGGRAISADRVTVKGDFYLRARFKAEGEVRLLGARVVGDLSCSDGNFINGHGTAIFADGSNVEGSIFLHNGFKAEGEVRLVGAKVGGNLECANSRFANKDGNALSADGLKVKGSVFLRGGFRAEGRVSLIAATIDKYFCLTGVDSPEEITLDLVSAKIGTLEDDPESWPEPVRLLLHGLEYMEISDESPRDSETRIEWLRRQKDFSPQPYEQLAKVLRESGDGAGARDVLVAKNKDKADRTELTRAEWLWYRLFGRLIGYGHKPWLAAPVALVIILFGSIFFKEGYSHGLVTPMSESAYAEDNAGGRQISEVYPVFNSLVYSIDVFVPVVDLRQAKYWLPNANRGSELVPANSTVLRTGGLLLRWLWFEIVCGWVLTTLFLVGLTGLVRT